MYIATKFQYVLSWLKTVLYHLYPHLCFVGRSLFATGGGGSIQLGSDGLRWQLRRRRLLRDETRLRWHLQPLLVSSKKTTTYSDA